MNSALTDKYLNLQENLRQYGSAIVAFSGGIDSSLVAYVAGQTLGEQALAVTSASASLKRADLELAKRLATDWGIRHQVIVTDEMSREEYRQNPTNRCFYCKTSLYTYLDELAETTDIEVVLNGTNTDDLGDHRPGLIAANNFAVRSPLAECGFNKQDIRDLAHHLGLDNADKPQAACLSSRFPYGTEITLELLDQVERAEEVLTDLGFAQCRVRHHGAIARLEVPTEQLQQAIERHAELNQRLCDAGYTYVTLDLAGFQSGSLNKQLIADQITMVELHEPQ